MTFKKTIVQEKATKLLSNKTYKHILLYGGSRSGKTLLLVRAIIIRSLKCTSRHIILRQVASDARQSLWDETIPDVLNLCFKGLNPKLNQQEMKITFYNDSKLYIGGLDDKARIEKILGKGASTIYFNECSQMRYASLIPAYTRLAEKNDLQKKFYYDCNPPSKTHWTYKLFIKGFDPSELEDKQKEDFNEYASMLMNPIDNIQNLDEGYIKTLKNLPEAERNRFLNGMFGDSYSGLVYKEFVSNYDDIVIEPIYEGKKVVGCIRNGKHIKFETWYKYYHGLDTGRHIGGSFLCIDEHGVIYIFNELALLDTLSEPTSKMIKDIIGWQTYSGLVIDSASQVKGEYIKCGLRYQDSEKDVLGSIEMTRNLIDAGKLFITSNCRGLINELSSRTWRDNADALGRIYPVKENDHICNSLEYILLTFLKNRQNIQTPQQKDYMQSLEYIVKQRPVISWQERG